MTRHDTIVTCGSGGVGKTTCAAVIAMHGARQGRNAIVVTIDPARRLANALGVESVGNAATVIDPKLWDPDSERVEGGSLSAVMLDTKSTFDDLVEKYSADEEQAQRIVENRFYRNLSTALSGTQEYMAMEKLYELHEDADYDLVIVDTPPSRNALDFLDAPDRLTRFLEGRFFRVLTAPARGGMRVVNRATRGILRAIGRIIGSEVLQDVIEFFSAFEGMYEGFHNRAARVREVLLSDQTAFILVASPRRDTLEEAEYLGGSLRRMGFGIAGAIVNRMHPRFAASLAQATRMRSITLAELSDSLEQEPPDDAGAEERSDAVAQLADLYGNLASFQEIAQREDEHLSTLTKMVEPAPVARIPFLGDDVHDLETLRLLENEIF